MNHRNIAPTPPMGWNSWDCYGAAVNEEELLGNARVLAAKLAPFGWEYLVCDIQWSEPTADSHEYHPFAPLCMDEYARLMPAPNRFPSAANGEGFKPIADQVHAMGLKFGIHIMRGIPRQAVHNNAPILGTDATARDIAASYSICPWNTDMYGINPDAPGAQEYYDSIFQLYASWDVDYVKVDDIANTEYKPQTPYSAKREIEMIRLAMDRCGRPMVLSLSPGPAPIANGWHLSQHANMWRMTGDFWDQWDKLKGMFDYCEKWYAYVGDGCWPDCDMLPMGKLCVKKANQADGGHMSNFTPVEQKTMMTLWCIFRSPLMMGGELTSLDDATLKLLTNPDVLAVHRLGSHPRQVMRQGNFRVWQSDGAEKTYTALFNLGDETTAFPALEQLGLAEKIAKNLWTGEAIVLKDCMIAPHGAMLLETQA